jgi:hypothetical protein
MFAGPCLLESIQVTQSLKPAALASSSALGLYLGMNFER